MDRPALFTAIAVGYAVGFMHSLDFAVVDVTLNVNGLQEVLQFAQMTPYAVSQHIKALRRCGGLVGYMLVFVYFAATHRSKRRRWTRTLFQSSSLVTTIAGITLHYASILRWGSVECPRMAMIGFVLLGFGYTSSAALGSSLLQGDAQAFPHPKRSAFANYLGRLCGLILAITLSPGLCFFVHTILIWSTAVATFSANRSLRNYGQEDYESLADQRAMSVKQSQTLAPYRSPAFLRALLAVGIPMTLLGNGPRRVRDEIVFANGSIGTFFLYENIARALLGGLLLSYNVIHKDYATVKKADDWKRAMLWSACVSLVIVASSVPGSQSGWYVSFVVADTMLASYWMNAASCFMPGLFPEGTNQAGMCLAWIVRLGWKLAAEPMVLWSLELFGIRFFMWSNVALRVLCTLTVIFATCILQRRDRDPHSRAANGSMASSLVTTIAGVTLHYASILRWGSVECAWLVKAGFGLLGFGYASSSALGSSLLQGDAQAFPHPRRSVLTAYQKRRRRGLLRYLLWSNVALSMLCTVAVIFATCTLRPMHVEEHNRAANAALTIPSENLSEAVAFFELFDLGAILLTNQQLSALAENALKRIAVTNLHSLVVHTVKNRPGFIGIVACATEKIPAKDAEVLEIPEELLPIALENCIIRGVALLCEDCEYAPNSPKCIWRTFRKVFAKASITRIVTLNASCFATTQDLIDCASKFRKIQVLVDDSAKFDRDALENFARQKDACKITFRTQQ